jgi:hypothetical protein
VIADVLLLAAFVAWERRVRMPMLPLSLFGSAQFTAANVVTFIVYGALNGAVFLLPIALIWQSVAHLGGPMPGRCHHPQPSSRKQTGTAAAAALRSGRTGIASRPAPMTSFGYGNFGAAVTADRGYVAHGR